MSQEFLGQEFGSEGFQGSEPVEARRISKKSPPRTKQIDRGTTPRRQRQLKQEKSYKFEEVEDRLQRPSNVTKIRSNQAGLPQSQTITATHLPNYVANKSRPPVGAEKPRPEQRRRRGNTKKSSSTHPLEKSKPLSSNRPRSNRPVASVLHTSTKSSQKDNRTSRRFSPLLFGTRMLILAVGISTLVGTLVSVANPASRISASSAGAKMETSSQQTQHKAASQPTTLQTNLKLSQEITPLKARVEALVKQNPKLQPGIFLVDVDTGAYLEAGGISTFPAASTIKLPILLAFFQDVDAGKIHLDEKLTLESQAIASGSGDLQYKKPGTKFSALEVVTKMITISDNTATNMAIARLGGIAQLNERFRSWGLTHTVIQNTLPDLEGTNTTSPRELANLVATINRGDLVSKQSRDRILEIMQKTMTNSLLPKGLGTGATIAHKTGDIGSLVADVGLITTPAGKHYIAAVMVKRPHNDAHAQELIRQISREAYQYFNTK